MKKLSIILASLLVTGYVVFSVIYFSNSSRNVVCNNFEVVLKDSTYVRFIRQSDIEDLLKRKKIYPVGKKMGEINTLQIQDTILTNRLVKSASLTDRTDRSLPIYNSASGYCVDFRTRKGSISMTTRNRSGVRPIPSMSPGTGQ